MAEPHTPGPWRAALGDDDGPRPGEFELACLEHHIFGTNIYAPGKYYSDDYAEHVANARLIAAAPDLLAVLKCLITDANRLCDRQLGGTYEEDCRVAIQVARAVIAKAEGQVNG